MCVTGEASLSVDQMNKMRAQLGLPPLVMEDPAAAEEERQRKEAEQREAEREMKALEIQAKIEK